MHGLWSGAEAWNLPLEDETSIDEVKTADYRATNASSFAENRYEPQKPMFDMCASNFSRNIVGAQVDYVGHSMGGNLARVYLAQAAPYKTIHRLYTLNTPHLGSPLANLLVELRDNLSPLKRFLLILAAERESGKPINRGAIDDLAVGSDALAAIPDTRVLSHALVGIGGSQWAAETLKDAPGLIGDVYRIVDFLSGPGDLFEGVQHDLVVGRDSQIGGLSIGRSRFSMGWIVCIQMLLPRVKALRAPILSRRCSTGTLYARMGQAATLSMPGNWPIFVLSVAQFCSPCNRRAAADQFD